MPPRAIVRLASVLVALVACSGEEGASGGASAEHDVEGRARPAAQTSTDASVPGVGAAAAPLVRSLANLGDSISQAFDADDGAPLDLAMLRSSPDTVFHDNPQLSWVQGSDPRVGSVASYHRARFPGLVVTPLSRAGAELVAIHRSLPNLELQARELGERAVAPDLVYVLLGGNDVCNRERSKTSDPTATLYSADRWREAVLIGLSALTQVLPTGATVRFMSMPRVDQLYDAVAKVEVPILYPNPTPGEGVAAGTTTCESLWAAADAAVEGGICPVVTREPSAARRAAIGARIDLYNDILAEEVRRFAADTTHNPKRIAFQSDWRGPLGRGGAPNTSGGTFVFEPKHISKRDCFHPSVEGQAAIATVAQRAAVWSP
jgi:lysophospholipase L1-like esterase